MTRRELGLIGTNRDHDALLAALDSEVWSLEEAVAAGVILRTKITNQWLYAPSAATLNAGLAFVEAEAVRRIQQWLLGLAPWLRGPISRASTRPAITAGAVDLLLRELARERRLNVLGLLTADYEPYLGLYAPGDADEVSRQIETMMSLLRRRGYVRPEDLPEPGRPRVTKGWRWMILRHGEFIGIGRLADSVLMSWNADGAA